MSRELEQAASQIQLYVNTFAPTGGDFLNDWTAMPGFAWDNAVSGIKGSWDAGFWDQHFGAIEGITRNFPNGGPNPFHNATIYGTLSRLLWVTQDPPEGFKEEEFLAKWEKFKRAIGRYQGIDARIYFPSGYSFETIAKSHFLKIMHTINEGSTFSTYHRAKVDWYLQLDRKILWFDWPTMEFRELDWDAQSQLNSYAMEILWTTITTQGDLESLMSSGAIKYVVDRLYGPEAVKKKITNKVNDFMTSLKNVHVTMLQDYWYEGSDPGHLAGPNYLSTLIKPYEGQAGWITMGAAYFDNDPPLLDPDRLTVVEDENDSPKYKEFVKGKLYKETIYFPRDLTNPDDDGEPYFEEIDPDLKRELESFSDFAGDKDITQYDFKYNTLIRDPGYPFSTRLGDSNFNATVNSFEEDFYFTYVEFLINVLKDWSDGRLQSTISDIFWNTFTDRVITNHYYEPILVDKEMGRRIAYFKKLVKLAEELEDAGAVDSDENPITILGSPAAEEELEKELNDGNKEFLEGLEVPPSEPLDDDDIEARRKFFKQCALLLNVHSLKQQHIGYLKKQAEEGYYPFDGRFWMAQCDNNQERLINNLIASEDGAAFFDIPPYVLSYLLPKIRLFRVESGSGELQETEFIFDQSTDINRSRNYTRGEGTPSVPDSFLTATFDKGDGCGLKEFSFEYKGTNPAEARNDLVATLSLHFQSFADFVRERIGTNGKVYRYVDLVLQPTDNQAKQLGIEIVHPHQYDPAFFRIRAEVGYNIPDNLETAFKSYDTERLRKAISRTNRSMYLVMVDHEITVNKDATVNVSISYRAYVETALKSLRFDALATPALLKERKERQADLYKLLTSGNCTKEQIQEYKVASAGKEEEHRQKSLQSIVRRLVERGKVYVTKINRSDAAEFRKNGFFNKCRLQDIHTDSIITEITPANALESEDDAVGALAFALRNNLPREGDFNYTDTTDTTIQYFFFGDLLHTILDTMFDPETPAELIQGMENTRIILGSFDFDPYVETSSGDVTMNIAQMPISVDFFMKWFTENVLVKGETRKTFPILSFIRNLSSTLVQNSLLEACVNKKLKKTTKFHTGQISAFADEIDVDPFGRFVAPNGSEIIVNTDLYLGAGLPLKGDAENEMRNTTPAKANHFYNYLILNVIGSSLTFTGTGDYADDIKKGRYHIDIGSNRGIVKTVSFAKTDMQYVREARFMQQGIDGLLQLSAVYKATVEMFGNTLFYPGMEVFINPYGIGGTTLGSPTQGVLSRGGRSLANKLGLGGYHTILSVKSSITPGDYKTTIQAQQYYAGDGTGKNPDAFGGALPIKADELASLTVTEEAQEGDQKDYCDNYILKVLNGDLGDPAETESPEASIEGIRGSDGTIIEGSDAPVTGMPLDGTVYSDVFIDNNGETITWEFDETSGFGVDGKASWSLGGTEVAQWETFKQHPEPGSESAKLTILGSAQNAGEYWSTYTTVESLEEGIADDQQTISSEVDAMENEAAAANSSTEPEPGTYEYNSDEEAMAQLDAAIDEALGETEEQTTTTTPPTTTTTPPVTTTTPPVTTTTTPPVTTTTTPPTTTAQAPQPQEELPEGEADPPVLSQPTQEAESIVYDVSLLDFDQDDVRRLLGNTPGTGTINYTNSDGDEGYISYVTDTVTAGNEGTTITWARRDAQRVAMSKLAVLMGGDITYQGPQLRSFTYLDDPINATTVTVFVPFRVTRTSG